MHAKLDETMTAVARASRDYTAYQRPGGWEFPALAYERATGISGIGQGYTIPGNVHPTVAHQSLVLPEIKVKMAERMVSTAQEMGSLPSSEQVAAFVQEKAQALSDAHASLPPGSSEDRAPQSYRHARREHQFAEAFQQVHNALGRHIEAGLQAALPEWREQERAGYRQMLDGLTERNPALAALPVDRTNAEQVKNVVDGALSGYNTEDIKSFSIDGLTSRLDTLKNAEWGSNDRAIQALAPNAPLEWVPSVSTQEKILGQLRERQAQQTVPLAPESALSAAVRAASAPTTPIRGVKAANGAPGASPPSTPSSGPSGQGAGRAGGR